MAGSIAFHFPEEEALLFEQPIDDNIFYIKSGSSRVDLETFPSQLKALKQRSALDLLHFVPDGEDQMFELLYTSAKMMSRLDPEH